MAVWFAICSAMTVITLVCVVTFVWSGVFSEYTRANMTELAHLTARKLAETYEKNGEWTTDDLVAAAKSDRISRDIGLQVLDDTGKILYDDTWPAAPAAADLLGPAQGPDSSQPPAADKDGSGSDSGSGGGTGGGRGSGAAHGLTSSAPTDQEGALTEPIELADGTVVGKLRMWVLGSDALLTKADTAFREKTSNAMFLAAIIAIAIAILIGLFVSRMLTNPIRRITGTAKQIRDGDLSARTALVGNDEIDQLGETFDEMATSLENDLKHERRLTSDVAHELRTPLMAMLATVEAMQDGVLPADDEHLETVASETRRLSRLVQQMLDLSRMEMRTSKLNIERVDIIPFVQAIVASQQQLFVARDLRLRFADETQGRSVCIEMDPDMITQAIINLLSNAMRYTPEGGWVVVSVRSERRFVMISVKDTGIGIAKEDLSRIFSRFWRADASRAREAGGLGVGLAVTKQSIERHHGYISVESELEKGTTFTIHLPREQSFETPSTTMDQ